MPTVDDAAILKRAKELCERDGVIWNVTIARRTTRLLDDGGRREYLMRAREQLLEEQADAV
jgi:hypothetical protein